MSSNVRYINEPPRHPVRPLSTTVNEAKEEFKQFAETRLSMLQSELREKLTILKSSAPMLAVGGLFAFTAFLALTGALIALVWAAFAGWRFGMFFAFLIVAVFYAIIGAGAFAFGFGRISQEGFLPNRTIKVLKEDRIWLQNEARAQSEAMKSDAKAEAGHAKSEIRNSL
jgi:uncharacterized membrane protein YqjE